MLLDQEQTQHFTGLFFGTSLRSSSHLQHNSKTTDESTRFAVCRQRNSGQDQRSPKQQRHEGDSDVQ